MKRFDSTKEKYNCLFLVATILTNFLHECYLNNTYKIIGDQIDNATKYGWHEHL
jgi:hypothetical protein